MEKTLYKVARPVMQYGLTLAMSILLTMFEGYRYSVDERQDDLDTSAVYQKQNRCQWDIDLCLKIGLDRVVGRC